MLCLTEKERELFNEASGDGLMESENSLLSFYLTFQRIAYFGFFTIVIFRGGKKMENTCGLIDHDCFQTCTSHFAWLYFCDISLQIFCWVHS